MPGNKRFALGSPRFTTPGRVLSRTEITVGAGASSVLYAAMTALLQPGDEVVMQEPGYDLYAGG